MTREETAERIKPEAKLRPWKPEEVPVGALTRGIGKVGFAIMIVGHTPYGIVFHFHNEEKSEAVMPFTEAMEKLEHSTDGGKTWKPCGVEE